MTDKILFLRKWPGIIASWVKVNVDFSVIDFIIYIFRAIGIAITITIAIAMMMTMTISVIIFNVINGKKII